MTDFLNHKTMSLNFDELNLQCGSVFYGPIASLTSPEPHFIILLNENPATDNKFALVVASSKIKRVDFLRKKFGYDTIAEIEIGTESFFKKPTYINCNDVKLLEIKYIRGKYNSRDLKYLNETMSETNLKQLVKCVRNSSVVSEEMKKLLPNF